MNKKIALDPPLFVFKEINSFSSPQKCKVPQNLMITPATNLVIVKCNENKYLCRVFYLNECYNSKSIAYIDTAVEIEKGINRHNGIRRIDEFELIDNSKVTEFTNATVKLVIDFTDLNLDIIKTNQDIKNITKIILRNFYFTTNCSILCQQFGIKRIFVTSTSELAKYGRLRREGNIEIEEILVETSTQKHIQLGGLSYAERQLANMINDNIEYMKYPQNFTVRPQCQALIHGPIGSGKTSLVHLVSRKFNCNFFEISGDIFKPYPGETEEELENIFNRIKKISNIISTNISIVLIENIELFCPTINDNSHSSRISSLIYSYLDNITNHTKGILVIATTSKIERVNIALKRINRLGIEIALDMPDETQRFEITKLIIERLLTNHFFVENIDELSIHVAKNTSGFVGADLEVLCQHVLRSMSAEHNDIKQLFQNGYQKICPSVMRDNLGHITRSSMTLDNIAGMDGVKKSLLTSILGPLKNADKFHQFGLYSPSGILLYGPSGCAKTTIVKCLAGETKMTLISVSSAEIYSPYVGEAEKFIARLFNRARQSAPAILFFDEIDTIVGSRNKSNANNDANIRILSTFLTEIDGFGGNNGKINKEKPVIVIGATNRPEFIDDALMRPGRFDKLLHIPAPDYKHRLQILTFLLKRIPAVDVDIDLIAKRTEFFSGADLTNLCNEAAICAATRDLNCDRILPEDFENVFSFLKPSLSKEKINFYNNFEMRSKIR